MQEGQEHKLAGLLTKDALEDFEQEHAEDIQGVGKSIAMLRKALQGFTRCYVAQRIAKVRADLS